MSRVFIPQNDVSIAAVSKRSGPVRNRSAGLSRKSDPFWLVNFVAKAAKPVKMALAAVVATCAQPGNKTVAASRRKGIADGAGLHPPKNDGGSSGTKLFPDEIRVGVRCVHSVARAR
ncbi:MAG: hypothetical protein H7Z75_16245 [Ferruginibacter sp.]|nr:hypothetical protein [Cytophagales bacterium]